MAISDTEKSKLSKRLNRIRGQLEALQRALEKDSGSTELLQQATACRGALDSFIAEIIEHHIRHKLHDPEAAPTPAAEELITIIHTYLT